MKKICILALACALTAMTAALVSCDSNKEAAGKYLIVLSDDGNGAAVADPTRADAGATITLTATPKENFAFEKWMVLSGGIEFEDATVNPVTFTMPEADVAIRAAFVDDSGLTTDEGVTIGGIVWATRNVGAPGTFAATPEDYGMLYQFNRKTGWSVTDPRTSSPASVIWNGDRYAAVSWVSSTDPCPAGWHVPNYTAMRGAGTISDISKVDLEWKTINGVNGTLFTDLNSHDTMFLPAAGARGADGAVYDVSVGGNIWSSTAYNDVTGGFYYFNANGAFLAVNGNFSVAFSVRCTKNN